MSANNNQPSNNNFGIPPLFASPAPHLRPPGFPNQLHRSAIPIPNPNPNLGSPPIISGISGAEYRRLPTRPPAPHTTAPSSSVSRKKKQKKEKNLPEKQVEERVANILPDSVLYSQMVGFEAMVDDTIARKKAAVQEALMLNPPPLSIQKTLRLFIFNTFANQSCTEKPNVEPPSWTLRIVGSILEDELLPGKETSSMYPKFTSFLDRVTISLDPKLYPDNHTIVWDRTQSPSLPDGFEVKRKGDQEFTVNITLELNNIPEKYKLSPALNQVLGVEVDTRPRIVSAIFHYIKAMNLQSPDDPCFFICDPLLERVFGKNNVRFTEVPQKITRHLFPPQPIKLQHRIKLSGNSPFPAENAYCYDVVVDVPSPVLNELNNLLASTDKSNEIAVHEEAISRAIMQIQEHRRRRAFLLGFSQSPVEFVNALLESQSKGEERRSDIYTQPWVEDAVIRYLNRKPAPDAPTNM